VIPEINATFLLRYSSGDGSLIESRGEKEGGYGKKTGKKEA